jgi:hypothetical protein
MSLFAVAVLLAAGCSPAVPSASAPGAVAAGVPATVGAENLTADPSYAWPAPGDLRGPVRRAELLLVGPKTLPVRLRRSLASTDGVRAVLSLSLATAPVGDRMVTIASAEPATYRRFTPVVAARATEVWQRVAEGDIAIAPALADVLDRPLGSELALGNSDGALTLRIGAEASMVPRVDAVVNPLRGRQLGMVPGNALVVSTSGDPDEVGGRLREKVGRRASVSRLTGSVPDHGEQTAFLTGGSVSGGSVSGASLAEVLGAFRYRWFPDGTVAPDPAWARANIRTETVPLLGTVTCHRVMLTQLRGALEEVVDRGLAGSIDPDDFGGCYVPRFVAHDPVRGLSLHTWGIALDLNVRGNQRGTAGEIDPRVVETFKRWGFAWGGDWSFTDPMHFELAALVQPGS